MKKAPKVKEQLTRPPVASAQRDWTSSAWRYRYFLVFFLAFIIYADTIPNDYNLDDTLVTKNHAITSQGLGADNLQKIFTQPYYQDNMGYSYGYRPLTILSFTVEHSIFGDSPHVNHFFNLLFYGLLCIVLLKASELMLSGYNRWLPLIAISLFACHPLHTEVVASIKNRDEILSFLCGGLVICVLFGANRPFWQRLILALVLFISGMLFKPNLVMLPGLLVLALLAFRNDKPLYVFLISALFSIVSVYFIENMNDGIKFLYVLSNLLFCLVLTGIFRGWRPLAHAASLSSKFIRERPAADIDSAPDSSARIRLLGGAYYTFIGTNIFLTLIAFYLSSITSNPWILVMVGFIFAIEFWFLGFEQWWPVIVLFDAVVIFLASAPYSQAHSLLIGDNLSTLFFLFHIALVASLKDWKFWPAFALLLVAFILYDYQHDNTTGLIMSAVGFPLIVFIYHRGWYTSRYYKIFLFIPIFLNGLNLLADKVNFYFDLIVFLMLLLVFCVSYFKVAISRIPPFIALAQIAFIAYVLFSFSDFHMGAAITLSKTQTPIRQMGQNLQSLNQAQQLPSAYNSIKVQRPIAFIEVPVDYSSSPGVKIATSLYQFDRYALLLIKPWPMSFYYGYKVVTAHRMTEPLIIVSLFLLLALVAIAFFLIRRNKVVSFAIFFMLMSVFPYLYMVSMLPGMLADRYTFQASFGFCLLLAFVILYLFDLPEGSFFRSYLKPENAKTMARVFFLGIICGYATLSIARNNQWKDAITLMRHDIMVVPESAQAHNLLGINLVIKSYEITDPTEQKQMREEALSHVRAANDLYPGYFNFTYDIGRLYNLLGSQDSAIYYFQKAYEINPQNALPDLMMGLAMLYQGKGDTDRAIYYYQRYIPASPQDINGYNKLSYLYFLQGKYQKAIDVCKSGEVKLPNNSILIQNVAQNFIAMKNADSALVYLYQAYKLNPNDAALNQTIARVQKLKGR